MQCTMLRHSGAQAFVAALPFWSQKLSNTNKTDCISDGATCHPLRKVYTHFLFESKYRGDQTVVIHKTVNTSYLAANPATVRGMRVVELGCGTGLCGIVAARLGARQVLLTDGNENLLDRAASNVAGNLPSDAPVNVRSLRWGEVVDEDLRGSVDVVLASDVLYQSAAWRPLAACVQDLLRPKVGRLLLAEAGHETTPAQASIAGFRAVAEGCGLSLAEAETLAYGDTLLVQAKIM